MAVAVRLVFGALGVAVFMMFSVELNDAFICLYRAGLDEPDTHRDALIEAKSSGTIGVVFVCAFSIFCNGCVRAHASPCRA